MNATAAGALAGLLVVLVLFSLPGEDLSAEPPFEPGAFVCYEVMETVAQCDGDASPGAVTDIHNSFCLGWNGDCSVKDTPVMDSNFGAVVGFTPPEFPIPSANDLPIGTLAGRLTSLITLGVLNNPCNLIIEVAFTLMNASVNISDTIDPKPPGNTDIFEPLARDVNPANGIPDGVDKYPSFLNEIFNNNQPRARFFGITFIQGYWVPINFVFFEPGITLSMANQTVTFDPNLGVPSVTVLNNPEAPPQSGPVSDFCAPLLVDHIVLGLTVDNPCTPVVVSGAACPPVGNANFDGVFESRGYPLFPCEFGNDFDEDGDGAINDGCPQGPAQVGEQSENERLGGDCTGGDEGGCIYRQNPASAGDVLFTTLTASQRDHDGDGIENVLDVCWDDPNPDWDPRANDPENDPDGDGLANDCDPDPNTASPQNFAGCAAGIVGPDEDLDCFSNRADNCPLVNQLEDPSSPPHETNNVPIATDSDSDGVGDACDPAPNAPDAQGVPAFVCLEMTLGVGGGTTKAVASYDPDMSLDCAAAAADADGDGVNDTDETPCGGNALDPDVRPERVDGPFAGVDDDGDTQVDEPLPAGAENYDCDGDGYTGTAESHVYSYLPETDGDQKVCGLYDASFPDPNQSAMPSQGWPSDFVTAGFPDSTEKLTLTDLTSFVAPVRYFGTNVGTNPGDVRWDISPGPGILATDINLLDLTALIAGSSGNPPMFGGQRAFGGPACPWPE